MSTYLVASQTFAMLWCVQVSILAADVATRIEGATQSALRKVQGQLSKGIVETLAAAEDLEALQAAGGHLVKVRCGNAVDCANQVVDL